MLNSVILMGRITKDPTLRKSGETIIVTFDIAVDNIRKEADGTRGTTFLPVVCFNSTGDNVATHLHKGSKIAVKGAIQQRNFLRQDGSKGSVYEIIADSVEFLDPKPVEPSEPSLEEVPVEEVAKVQPQEPKYDPMTGKPLKQSAKK